MVPALIAGSVGLSVALFVLAALTPARVASARRRVVELAPAEGATDPLAPSFANRILRPLAWRLTGIVMVIVPSRIVSSVRQRLEIAGSPISLRAFFLIWVLSGAVLPLTVLLLMVVLQAEMGLWTIIGFGFWAALGTYLPWVALRRRAAARAKAIQKRLPDAIDLIITNIEAGLGLQAALLTVSERMSGPIAEEFGRAVREISMGRERTEVFDLMAQRSGVVDMRLFARAVAQSERTGFPIARILRNHAAEIRERRRQIVREKAAKVPVKIILPTAMFIFPTLFMVILAPIGLYAVSLFE